MILSVVSWKIHVLSQSNTAYAFSVFALFSISLYAAAYVSGAHLPLSKTSFNDEAASSSEASCPAADAVSTVDSIELLAVVSLAAVLFAHPANDNKRSKTNPKQEDLNKDFLIYSIL